MRNSVALDSGPLVALFLSKQTRHEEAKAFVASETGSLVTTYPVVTEVAYLLSFHKGAQRTFIAWAVESLDIDTGTTADIPRIIEIMEKYEDLPADFADASLLAVCERRGIEKIASFDKDFDIYRTKSRKRLKNVFGGR